MTLNLVILLPTLYSKGPILSICLSNRTADLALRELRRRGIQLDTASSQLIRDCTPSAGEVVSVADELGIITSDSLEVLVGSQENRRTTGKLTTHLWTVTPPEGSFYALGDGAYLPTPCFCLLQQARELHLIQLCQMLGYYLGTEQIVRVKNGVTRKVALPPLTTEEELTHYLQSAKGIKGVLALREALRYTCANAASPQETNLQLMLTLPIAYYGFGLKPPIMNYEVELHALARTLYPHEKCYIDLCWPDAKRGLEYQGEEHKDQLGADYARFLAIDAEGHSVRYLAKEQLQSPAQMQYIARYIAEGIGSRTDRSSWPLEADTQRLIDIISGKAAPKKGERRRQLR